MKTENMTHEEKIKVVKNPNTSPETLRELSDEDNRFLYLYLASNRNTPPDVLKKLAEDDEQSKDCELMIVNSVLGNPNCPAKTLALFAEKYKDYDFYETVQSPILIPIACNPNTPPETLAMLLEHRDIRDYCIQCVAENPHLPLAAAMHLAKTAHLNLSLAQSSPHPEVLNLFLKDKSYIVRSCVAQNPAATEQMLEQISKNELKQALKPDSDNWKKQKSKEESIKVLRQLARNRKCNKQTILNLRKVNDKEINTILKTI